MTGISSRPHCVKLFEAEGMYASVNKAIIGSDNGLLPDWNQAIIWTSDGLM